MFEVQFPRASCIGQLEVQFLPSKATLENAAMMEVVVFKNVPRCSRMSGPWPQVATPRPLNAGGTNELVIRTVIAQSGCGCGLCSSCAE